MSRINLRAAARAMQRMNPVLAVSAIVLVISAIAALIVSPHMKAEEARLNSFVQTVIQAGPSGDYVVADGSTSLPLKGLMAFIKGAPAAIRPCLRDKLAPWAANGDPAGVPMVQVMQFFDFCTVKAGGE